jgi:hypothetical protein
MINFKKQKEKFINEKRVLLIKKQVVGLNNKYYIKLWVRVIKYHNLIRVESSSNIDLFFDYSNIDEAIKTAIKIYQEG